MKDSASAGILTSKLLDVNKQVNAWHEQVTISTYGLGMPEKNPVFLEKRVYQGSSGVVYPHPVIEKILDEKEDKEYQAIFLENKYLKIMILPELGGRVQMAYDKTKNRHFVYYNQVIKPALVGLTGPWISGGIEFNWPQHHRPSSYDPVDALIEENDDGSVTVWCSEVERMFRTKGMAGFTLYPDKAYMEIKVKLFNRTPHTQTFLWWANPAVKVNDDYQSVFPPDVNAVFDHGKRDVSTFPIATGTYYKVDYSAGVDISRYKNIPVPTSYMAITSKYNFVGGYEHDSKGGLLHIADHHQSPGKKQWTWGNGDFGRAWDRNLTDEDGPYIELMCGVYTDNQPDFSWLQPYEEKSFKQYFMPYRDLGLIKNATRDAMLNLEEKDGKYWIRVYATGVYPAARISITSHGKILLERRVDLDPESSFEESIESIPDLADCHAEVVTQEGRLLVDWKFEVEEKKDVPKPARAAKSPQEITSTEQLYLSGQHLEQYRHASYDPRDYYLEALRREPGDVRNNNAMGLWLMKRGKFTEAEQYFHSAVATLLERNPNPYDGEPLYNLGLCQDFQGNSHKAYDNYFKSSWNGAWQDSAYFHVARIDARQGNTGRALEMIDRSLWRNMLNQKALHLKIVLLRKQGLHQDALEVLESSLEKDAFNFGALYEKYLIVGENNLLLEMKELMRDNVHNYIEYSLDYAMAGYYDEAISFISLYLEKVRKSYPMAWYMKAWYLARQGNEIEAKEALQTAGKMSPDYCFPNKLEELIALQKAVELNPTDYKAWYYMGNFWYAGKQYEDAVSCWERSRKINPEIPTVHRNLALAYFNIQKDPVSAKISFEQAYRLDESDARILMELDQLHKKMNLKADDRLRLLEAHPEEVEFRDDLYLEKVTLLNLLGEEAKALELIMARKFHPWEGGEGKVTRQYLYSHIELAKKAILDFHYKEALTHLQSTASYPHNLGEGKLYGTQENDISYWMACAHEGLGDTDRAIKAWEKASLGLSEPTAAMYYNDQQPDMIFYQGLALLKLGRISEAHQRFNRLISFGNEQLTIPFKMDYFAVSLPDLLIFEEDLQLRHEQHCNYLIALGQLGLGRKASAKEKFLQILKIDKYHTGARIHSDSSLLLTVAS